MSTTDAPRDWTRGYDLAFLKQVAGVFREAFKPHTYGAFGIPKERDVADAHAEGNLIWVRKPKEGPVTAAAIFRVLKSDSAHEDFAGRTLKMRKGDLFIRHIAGGFDDCRAMIDALAARSKAPVTWVEAHAESETIVRALFSCDFVRIITKISASSDIRGVWRKLSWATRLSERSAESPAPLDPADIPGAKIIAYDYLSPAMLRVLLYELEDHAAWAQHYSSYNKRQSWTAFALAGYDARDPGFIIKPSEMSKGWKSENAPRLGASCGPTVAAENFPAAMEVVARIPGAKQRVRFMRLSANGGELSRHSDITDPEAGTRDGQIMRLHIPLATDARCLFRSWSLEGTESRVHFPARSLCYLDTRKPHAVINPADCERIHLVVDVYATPGLRKLIA